MISTCLASSAERREALPRRATSKLLLGCGIASSVLYVVMNIVTPLRYPGYSAFSQTISELSAIDAPSRPLWMALGAVYAALLIAFGSGVWLSAHGKRALRVAGALLVGLGVTGYVWPLLPGGASMHGREVLAAGGATLTDTLHLISGGVGTVLCLLIIGFGAAAFGTRFRIYSVATIVVLLGFGFWTGLEAPMVSANEPTPWLGVIERIMFASFVLWFAVLAIVLLRAERPESYRGAATPDDRVSRAHAAAYPEGAETSRDRSFVLASDGRMPRCAAEEAVMAVEDLASEERTLDRKIEAAGWGVLFVWIGVALLAHVGWGVGLIGVGLVTLAAQGWRRHLSVKVDGFALIVGAVFLLCGIWNLFDLRVELVPLLFIVAGVYLLASLRRKHRAPHPRAD